MRPQLALALALLASALASAADIALPDGRIFREASIVGQSPTAVTIRHAEGFAQVEKAKLPPELAAQYPVDAAAAAATEAESQRRAAALSAAQAAKAQQIRSSPSRTPAVSAVRPAEPSFEFPPKLTDARDRWRWRTKPLTIGPGSLGAMGPAWTKLVDFTGVRHFRQHIDLPPGVWRILVTRQIIGRENSWGNRNHTSVIVTSENGAKLACSVDCLPVYGNVSGKAVIDGETISGTINVVLECAEVR